MDPSTNDAPHHLGDRFQIESKLGRGGSGDVYKAFDTVLERTVAVKVLRRENTEPQAAERLLREARACARLTHPNIVTIHDVLQLDSGICIVMEHLEGSSLDAAEGGPGARTLEGRIGIVGRILEGLEYAHGRGVVHRDVKPRNVQLLPDESIKVLDFGVAHIAGVDTLTVTGTITGTVHYASPEQLRGERTDARTDIYSAGILAYELLTGRRPFDGDSMGAVVTKVLHDPLPEMGGDRGGRHPEVERIIRRATAKDREDRYESAEAMRNALDAAVKGMKAQQRQSELGPLPGAAQAASRNAADSDDREEGTTAATAATTPPHRTERDQAPNSTRRWWPQTVAAGAIAAAVIGGVLWSSGKEATETPQRRPATQAARASDVVLPTAATPAAEERAAGEVGTGDEAIPIAAEPREQDGVEAGTQPPTEAAAPERAPEAAATTEPTDSAKVLYYRTAAASEEGQAADAGTNAGIRYRVLRRGPDGEPVEVDANTTFRSGDRIRFSFEPNVDGFLYVVQRGSTGQWSVLLPHPEINEGRNAVTKFEEVTIPPEGWFRMDDNPGTEQVFVYLSRKPTDALPGGDGQVVRPHTADEHTVSVLAGSVQSRDLVFETEDAPGGTEQAAYVVNQGNAGGAVPWTVELEHR